MVWWINEFFRSFQIELVIVTGKPRSGKGERLAHALLTLQLQCVSPCLQLCNVNTFCCSVNVLHKEKTFVGMNMPSGILNESYGLCCVCRMEARLNSLAFHYSVELSFTVAFKL